MKQIPIELIRQIVGTFALDGMETADKIKALMRKDTTTGNAALAAPRLKEILEEQLQILFVGTLDSDKLRYAELKRQLQQARDGTGAATEPEGATKKKKKPANPKAAKGKGAGKKLGEPGSNKQPE